MEMETLPLKELAIVQGTAPVKQVPFEKASLVLVTQYGDRSWYIEVDGVIDQDLLIHFGQSDNIKVEVLALLANNTRYHGTGYFHPNAQHQAAAIRGDGELTIPL